MRRGAFVFGLIICFVLAAFGTGQAQETWPDFEKTITVVVPYSAGGGTDLIFRPLVEEM